MLIGVEEATYVIGYTIHLRFSDGTEGDIDLKAHLYGPVFEPLLDLETFRSFTVHPELRTITWPNGADFAPEFLYEKAQVTA